MNAHIRRTYEESAAMAAGGGAGDTPCGEAELEGGGLGISVAGEAAPGVRSEHNKQL